jgi:hypothetical protein
MRDEIQATSGLQRRLEPRGAHVAYVIPVRLRLHLSLRAVAHSLVIDVRVAFRPAALAAACCTRTGSA